MAVLTSYEVGQDSFLEIGNGGGGQVRRAGQSFQIQDEATCTDADIYVKLNTGQNQLTIRIETDSGGNPSGTLVDANATGTIEQASIGEAYAFVNCLFMGVFSLVENITYWLVVKRTVEVGNDQNYNWGSDNSSPSYAFGHSNQYLDAWGFLSGEDLLFRINGIVLGGADITPVRKKKRLMMGVGL